MQVVRAALEAYARRYATLGIRLNEHEAQALVVSVIQDEHPEPTPTTDEVHQLARTFVQRVDELAKQPL